MDWSPGDLAQYVDTLSTTGFLRMGAAPGHTGPQIGAIYTVEAVLVYRGEIGLVIAGHHCEHPTRAWHAAGFRKVRPHIADEEDAQTIYELTYAPSPVFTGEHQQ